MNGVVTANDLPPAGDLTALMTWLRAVSPEHKAAQSRPVRSRRKAPKGIVTPGRRAYPEAASRLQPGDYWRIPNGHWYACVPGIASGWGRLDPAAVTVHEDGTISVSGLISVHAGHYGGAVWRGQLVHGDWYLEVAA